MLRIGSDDDVDVFPLSGPFSPSHLLLLSSVQLLLPAPRERVNNEGVSSSVVVRRGLPLRSLRALSPVTSRPRS